MICELRPNPTRPLEVSPSAAEATHYSYPRAECSALTRGRGPHPAGTADGNPSDHSAPGSRMNRETEGEGLSSLADPSPRTAVNYFFRVPLEIVTPPAEVVLKQGRRLYL